MATPYDIKVQEAEEHLRTLRNDAARWEREERERLVQARVEGGAFKVQLVHDANNPHSPVVVVVTNPKQWAILAEYDNLEDALRSVRFIIEGVYANDKLIVTHDNEIFQASDGVKIAFCGDRFDCDGSCLWRC